MKEDVLEAIRRLGNGALDFAQNRLRLLQSEVSDEVERLTGLLTRLIVMALAGLLTAQFLALVVLAATWDTPWRLTAMVALAALAALGTLIAYSSYQARRRSGTSGTREIFAASLNELQKDREALEKAG